MVTSFLACMANGFLVLAGLGEVWASAVVALYLPGIDIDSGLVFTLLGGLVVNRLNRFVIFQILVISFRFLNRNGSNVSFVIRVVLLCEKPALD